MNCVCNGHEKKTENESANEAADSAEQLLCLLASCNSNFQNVVRPYGFTIFNYNPDWPPQAAWNLADFKFWPPPHQRSWAKAEAVSSHYWLWRHRFLPSPKHETCFCCSAMSGLMKLAFRTLWLTSLHHESKYRAPQNNLIKWYTLSPNNLSYKFSFDINDMLTSYKCRPKQFSNFSNLEMSSSAFSEKKNYWY